MPDFIQHEMPRRNYNGQTSIYCRQCGREIARTVDSRIRSVSKCAICVLKEQGVMDAEQHVLTQYVQLDPTKPPIPRDAEGEDSIFILYPEEKDNRVRSSGGIIGTAKAVYRALGFGKEPDGEVPESRKTAVRRRRGSLNS